MKDYAKKYKRKTRLSRLEEKRNIKQASVFAFLSIALLLILLFIGIPLLTKAAVLLGEYKSSKQKPEKTDTLAPNPPTFQPTYEATNSATLSLQGYAETDSKIKIILNGQTLKEIETDAKGEFKIKSLALQEGKNKIKAKATDKEDNESDFSEEIVITLDTEKPKLEISSPHDGDKFFDKDKEIKIEGSTEEETTVYINNRLATVDYQGAFSLSLELHEGDNELKIVAEDPAGNKTEKQIKVTYTP